jgi:NDP-sugar pyrophosphorylase family protein
VTRHSYVATRGCVYRARGLTLPRSVAVGKGTVIGENVTVGHGTRLSGSVIGRGCCIGE